MSTNTESRQVAKLDMGSLDSAIIGSLRARGAMCAPDLFDFVQSKVAGVLDPKVVHARCEQLCVNGILKYLGERNCENPFKSVYDLNR